MNLDVCASSEWSRVKNTRSDKQVRPRVYKYGCRCKASIVKRRGQVIYELVREPDV